MNLTSSNEILTNHLNNWNPDLPGVAGISICGLPVSVEITGFFGASGNTRESVVTHARLAS